MTTPTLTCTPTACTAARRITRATTFLPLPLLLPPLLLMLRKTPTMRLLFALAASAGGAPVLAVRSMARLGAPLPTGNLLTQAAILHRRASPFLSSDTANLDVVTAATSTRQA